MSDLEGNPQATDLAIEPGVHTAFFYGTLMHPKILRTVIRHNGSQLQICPAILLEHTRHKVKWAEYPGVVPYSRSSKSLFTRELEPEERCVRGTLVTGLTEADLGRLDYFEGPDYGRQNVQVHKLGEMMSLDSYQLDEQASGDLLPTTPQALPDREVLTSESGQTDAQTYVFKDISELEAEMWSFEEFVKENAWKWYRSDS
ncbi:hypothetical protein BDN72DRAFT_832739 [Pluteus cervinus]|uniref:Uncharacterized protein n=1 Tax=Pluteus cervinus TaxID=181527 RepID=A0ACD3BB10_9AGAR|nr:hypothetical protein BDN72DRAFT_832739 [Pluteus cervinus]